MPIEEQYSTVVRDYECIRHGTFSLLAGITLISRKFIIKYLRSIEAGNSLNSSKNLSQVIKKKESEF